MWLQVQAKCNSCHRAGVLDAPKIGDKADWARVAQGMDAIVQSAVNGKGNMAPRGGDASLSDKDLKKVVIYMLAELRQSVDADKTENGLISFYWAGWLLSTRVVQHVLGSTIHWPGSGSSFCDIQLRCSGWFIGRRAYAGR